MSLTFRYLITAIFAFLMFGYPLAIVAINARKISAIEQRARDQLIAAGRAEEAAALSFQSGQVDFGMELTPWEMNGVLLYDLVLKFWWACILAAVAVSYGVFLITGYFPAASARSRSDQR